MDQNVIDQALQKLKDHIPKIEWTANNLQDSVVFSGTPKQNGHVTVRFMVDYNKLDDNLLATAKKMVKMLI